MLVERFVRHGRPGTIAEKVLIKYFGIDLLKQPLYQHVVYKEKSISTALSHRELYTRFIGLSPAFLHESIKRREHQV